MKSRGLSALLIQRVHGPETLARGTPRLHSLRSLPEAQGSGNATLHAECKGFPFQGLLQAGQPHLWTPQDRSLPVLFPPLDHNSLAEYVTGLMQLNSNVCV